MIAVLGPGGVGGFIAAALARDGQDVTGVARESTAAKIRDDGVEVRSVVLGDFTGRPAASAALQEPATVLIVATKALGLADALQRIHADPQLVVPLLNGLDHMVLLRQRFGADAVAAGSIRIEADRPAPAQVVQTSKFLRIDVAADRPAPRSRLEALAPLLEHAGIPARIER
ncbi:MAG: 2-dehydropantoate 2-reductase, partial [Actinomycetota bacterium]|nr:2-dehydropantoate 2-reductase [Actinomycetota bacterium]